jgi:hypothetical protein
MHKTAKVNKNKDLLILLRNGTVNANIKIKKYQ